MAWSLLIVDDHADFRAGARALLEVDGFDVVGEAADGESALEAARRLRPQVVLLDIQLPGIDGFRVAERLAAGADPPMVVLTSSRAPEAFRGRLRAARLGAWLHREGGAVRRVPFGSARLSPVTWGAARRCDRGGSGGRRIRRRPGDARARRATWPRGWRCWAAAPWRGRAARAPEPARSWSLSGVAWFAGDLSSALLYAHRGPLVHLLLTYPSGRTSSRVTLVVIAAAYVDGLIPDVARSEWITLALMGAVLLVAAWRHRAVGGRRAARAGRRAGGRGDPVRGTRVRCVDAVARRRTGRGGRLGLYGAVVAIGCGLTADLLWGRWGRAALTGLVIDLGDRHEPQALRAALARTLGDPGLELAYRVDGHAGWVDEAGRPVRLPSGADGGARDAHR